MEARAIAAEATAAVAEARAVASEAAARKYAAEAAAATAELQRLRAQLVKVQSPQQRRGSVNSLNTPTAMTPATLSNSPLSAVKKRVFGDEGAELLCSLENSMDFDSGTWPTSMTSIISGEPGVDYVDHKKRLAIVGFVIGNGGNVTTLLEFLSHRRLLRDASSIRDFNVIVEGLERNPDFKQRSYYYDMRVKKLLNFFGDPR